MSMTKIINPAGWGWDRPVAQMVKVSSRGLTGTDRRDFIKMAGATAPAFLRAVDAVKFAKDEVPVHLLAMGATEFWGPNRNGDGFKAATCKGRHDTFVKFARWYRNHKNKDPRQSHGVVKASAYSDAMHRIELLVALNAEKSAADRNGGLVADREVEKLARGDDIPVSMACRVPYDVCSGCQHRARTRAEYCKEATCKYGGCSKNLTKIAADGHILHVDNPNASFFDISDVFRPADRIAYGATADWLQKAASATDFVPGAELAEALGVTAPLSVCLSQDEPWGWDTAVRGQVKLAAGLAAAEGGGLSPAQLKGLHPSLQTPLGEDQLSLLGRPGTEKSAESLAALADRKVLLTIGDFARWTGRQELAKAAAEYLPGVYRRLAGRGDLHGLVVANPYACGAAKTASAAVRALARNLEDTHSLASHAVSDRAMRCELRRLGTPECKTAFEVEKSASDAPGADALAEEYGLYKLAALHRIAATDLVFHLTASLAIGQNKVM